MISPKRLVSLVVLSGSLAIPSLAAAQDGEARCNPAANPLKYYLLRVDGQLKKFDAAEVVEISKDGQICAATPAEAEAWVTTLQTGRQSVTSQSQKRLDEIRTRFKNDEKLKTDIATLKVSLDGIYDNTQDSIKSTIGFVLDVFTGNGLLVDKLMAAAKSYALSSAINDSTISFAVDSASMVFKGGGAGTVTKGLSTLALKDLCADFGATKIAETWVKPPLDHLKDIAKSVDEATARSLLEGARDYSTTAMSTRAFLDAIDRGISRAQKYVTGITPQLPKFDGTWQSSDADHRFKLECAKGTCQWVERNKSGVELARKAKLVPDGANFRLDRANDAEVLTFLGFQPSLKQEILNRSPKSSYLIVSANNGTLNATWYGLLVVKDNDAKLKELKNPGDAPPKAYTFNKAP